jgi:hypothetical protein
MLEQYKELLHVKNPWPLEPLASILHAHQRDRTRAEFEDGPPLGALEDQVYDFPHIGLLTLGPVANRATTIPLPSASAYPRVPSSQRGWMWTQMFDRCNFRVE